MKAVCAIGFIFLMGSCASTRSISHLPEVIGNWEWVSSTGGYAGQTSTPQTTHKTQQMQVTSDSVFHYERGELRIAEAYRLIRAKSQLSNEEGWMLEGSDRRVFVVRKDSSLILMEDCWDCFTHTYHRIPER